MTAVRAFKWNEIAKQVYSTIKPPVDKANYAICKDLCGICKDLCSASLTIKETHKDYKIFK